MRQELRVLLISFGAVITAAVLRWWIDEEMGQLVLFSPFYIAVMVGAWLGGWRPALFATIMSLGIHSMFFSDPLFNAGIDEVLVNFILYAIVCLSITFFGEAIHREKRRALEQADMLRLAEERSSRAQLAARVGVWEGDPYSGQWYFSPEFRNIHGWGAGVFTLDHFFSSCHLDDVLAEKERFQQVLESREEEWMSLDRFIHPHQGLRWRYNIARIQYDPAGNATRISGTVMDVTDHQEAKELLRQAEERSSRAQQVAQSGTWEMDLAQKKAYVSREFCHLIGIEYEPQMPLDRVLGVIHPDDQRSFEQNFKGILERRERYYKNESRHLLPDGEVRWRMARGEVNYNEAGEAVSMVGITIDVTERKQADLALQQSEQRFRLATEAINGMVYDKDNVSGIVQRSEGLFGLIGIKPSGATPSEDWWISLVHPEDLDRTVDSIQRVRNERSPLYDLEYRLRHTEGHFVWVNDKGRLSYNEQGELLRIVGCATDITTRKKAELELQNADRRKDEFLATLAHELRNPLSPLQHAIDLLDDVASDRVMLSELRAMMERQMRHMVRLVDDLMDLSRISRGKIELRRCDIDLKRCLHTAIEANQHTIQRLGHEVKLSLPEGSCLVNGDPERLTQIFSNLLNNAAKFTPENGMIEVTLVQEGEDAQLEVRDNGNGLAPEVLERIFEMFVQAGDRSTNVSASGLGIGLNLVRRLVVMHGGTVQAHSEGLGKGSSFLIRLPLLLDRRKNERLAVSEFEDR